MTMSLLFSFLGGVVLAVVAFYIAAVSLRGRVNHAIASQLEPSLQRLDQFEKKMPELNQALDRLNAQASEAREGLQTISKLQQALAEVMTISEQCTTALADLRSFATVVEEIRKNGVELLVPGQDKSEVTGRVILVLPKPDKGNFDRIVDFVRHVLGKKER
jgi:hypothetical protein